MSHQDHFERALASLHEATFDDSLWPATSALIDDACGSTGNGLVVCQGIGESAGIVHASFFRQGQPCEDLQREYVQVYHQLDERAPRLRLLADSQLVHVSSLFSEEELKTSAVYNELLFRLGARDGLNVRLDGPAGCHIFWGTGDPSGSAGWEPDQIDMMKRLLPHIRHFVWVRQALDDAEALAASLSGLLDNTRLGIIQLDHRGPIVEVNDRARRVLRQPGGLSEKDGFLSTRLADDDAILQSLLTGALPASGFAVPTGGTTTVRRRPPLLPLIVHVDPLANYRKGSSFGPLGALVLVVDPMWQPQVNSGLVSEVLGLTPAESRVATMLSEGKTVAEIALATGRQKSSIYWLLNQVYRKLGISRQADLVRLVLSLSELSGIIRSNNG